jgi:outer membrane receptor protein involved in Fe transport
LQWNPVTALHLTGGVRYDAVSFAYETNLAPTQTGTHKRPENATVRYSNLGPSLGFALTLRPELNLYGGFRESFRAPSEGQLFRQGAAENTVDLKPVKARSLEVGVRGEITGRLAYEISGYRMDIHNDILSYVRPEDGLTESVNAGRTKHQGVETGITLALPAGIFADLSLSWASHTFVEWSPRQNVSYAGNRLPQSPETLASARARSPIPGIPEGVIEFEWMQMGTFWMDAENQHEYEGYDLWNLRIEAPLAYGIAFSGRVMNLRDEAYAERASFNAFRGEELSPGRPRAVQIGLRYGWEQ